MAAAKAEPLDKSKALSASHLHLIPAEKLEPPSPSPSVKSAVFPSDKVVIRRVQSSGLNTLGMLLDKKSNEDLSVEMPMTLRRSPNQLTRSPERKRIVALEQQRSTSFNALSPCSSSPSKLSPKPGHEAPPISNGSSVTAPASNPVHSPQSRIIYPSQGLSSSTPSLSGLNRSKRLPGTTSMGSLASIRLGGRASQAVFATVKERDEFQQIYEEDLKRAVSVSKELVGETILPDVVNGAFWTEDGQLVLPESLVEVPAVGEPVVVISESIIAPSELEPPRRISLFELARKAQQADLEVFSSENLNAGLESESRGRGADSVQIHVHDVPASEASLIEAVQNNIVSAHHLPIGSIPIVESSVVDMRDDFTVQLEAIIKCISKPAAAAGRSTQEIITPLQTLGWMSKFDLSSCLGDYTGFCNALELLSVESQGVVVCSHGSVGAAFFGIVLRGSFWEMNPSVGVATRHIGNRVGLQDALASVSNPSYRRTSSIISAEPSLMLKIPAMYAASNSLSDSSQLLSPTSVPREPRATASTAQAKPKRVAQPPHAVVERRLSGGPRRSTTFIGPESPDVIDENGVRLPPRRMNSDSEFSVDSDDHDEMLVVDDVESERDTLYDALNKSPSKRTPEDLAAIFQGVGMLPAFSQFPQQIRKDICSDMTLVCLQAAGTVLVEAKDSAKADWYILLQGQISLVSNGEVLETLIEGMAFGGTNSFVSTKGDLKSFTARSACNDTHLLVVPRSTYQRLVRSSVGNLERVEEQGKLVCIYETGGEHSVKRVRAATKSKMIELFLAQEVVGDGFDDVFLTTFPSFISPKDLCSALLEQFRAGKAHPVVTAVFKWICNFPEDFTEPHAAAFVKSLTAEMATVGMTDSAIELQNDFAKLNPNVPVDAFAYTITKRQLSDPPLPSLDMEESEAADTNADLAQMVSVLHTKKEKKSSLFSFNKLFGRKKDDDKKRNSAGMRSTFSELGSAVTPMDAPIDESDDMQPPSTRMSEPKLSRFNSSANTVALKSRRSSIRQTLRRGVSLIARSGDQSHKVVERMSSIPGDFTSLNSIDVVRIYNSDLTCHFIPISPASSQSAVILAVLDRQGIPAEEVDEYELVYVTVSGEVCIVAEAPGSSFASLLPLDARYYLRRKGNNDRLPVPPPQYGHRKVGALLFDAYELALYVLKVDFNLFASVPPREYIDSLFVLKTTPKLNAFSDRFNYVTLWVCSEILGESSRTKRVDLIRMFVKVAKYLMDLRDYLGLFGILSGLGDPTVRKLKDTWERVPARAVAALEKMEKLMDPSRNMFVYRNLFRNSEKAMVPFPPLLMKDIFFINQANKTVVDGGLINVEKLRLIYTLVETLRNRRYRRYEESELNNLTSGPLTLKLLWRRERMRLGLAYYHENCHVATTQDQLAEMLKELSEGPSPSVPSMARRRLSLMA